MNNKAIAVKCSLHGPQIVRKRQLSSYIAYIPIIAIRGKEVGVCIMSHVKLITNVFHPISVKQTVTNSKKFHIC